MNVQTMTALLPVPANGPLPMGDEREQMPRFRHHDHPLNGIVYMGDERGRVKSLYGSSGKSHSDALGRGRIIDLYV